MIKTFYATIDTNIFVSSMMFPHSVPGEVAFQATKGCIIPVINDGIIKEYKEVLFRPKFNFDTDDIKTFLQDINKKAIRLPPLSYPFPLPDESDRIFLETTLSARKQFKDAFLVTGNKKHFPKEDFIFSPKDMKEIIAKYF